MNLERLPSAGAVACRAADLVEECVVREPDAVLLLPAGRTPMPLYAELVERVRAARLDLSRAQLFQLDELAGVGPDDPRGFHRFLVDHLLTPCGLGRERVHLLDGSATDLERVIRRHVQALAKAGGADLALLGVGLNGHVAFNEPGSQPGDRGRRVGLGAATLAGLAKAFAPAAPPTEGITLGLAEILAARRVVLLATGASKAAPLAALESGPVGPELPASYLSEHPDFIVLADEPATAALAG